MYKTTQQTTVSEQTVTFTSTSQTQNIRFNDLVGDITRIELLSVCFSQVQAPDAGFPWILRIPVLTVEDFRAYKLPQFANNPSSFIVDEALASNGKDITVVFDNSPITFIDFEKPPILLEGKRLQSKNIVLYPIVVSAVDGITRPFFQLGTLRLRFHCNADSMQMRIQDSKYVPSLTHYLPM
jgi:hypothetical protein